MKCGRLESWEWGRKPGRLVSRLRSCQRKSRWWGIEARLSQHGVQLRVNRSIHRFGVVVRAPGAVFNLLIRRPRRLGAGKMRMLTSLLMVAATALAFNVDIPSASTYRGPSGSYFGFSVDLHKDRGVNW